MRKTRWKLAGERGAALYRLLGPWLSLTLGVVGVVCMRHELDYAPFALVVALVSWIGALAASRVLELHEDRSPTELSRSMRILHATLPAAVSSTYQNALFFLVPLWFASATWGSFNIVFPGLLAALALLSCFDRIALDRVFRLRWRRSAFGAVAFFAALDPAILAITGSSSRWHTAVAAFVSGAAAVLFAKPFCLAQAPRTISFSLLVGSVAAGTLYFAQPLLPPVPVIAVDAGAGSQIVRREIVGRASVFEGPSAKVHAWFAVVAPERFEQRLRFVWRHDGEEVGRPIDAAMKGGRKAGFRTWTFSSRLSAGQWQVDLETETGQLVGRTEFLVR